jgi:hypothetical protein
MPFWEGVFCSIAEMLAVLALTIRNFSYKKQEPLNLGIHLTN